MNKLKQNVNVEEIREIFYFIALWTLVLTISLSDVWKNPHIICVH